MTPILIDKGFDLAQLYEQTDLPVFSSDNLAIYVQGTSPSVPTNNGVGLLGDAVSCKVKQELNGEYELTMQYPITGELYSEIDIRDVIVVQPDRTSGNQPFRIYRITKPIGGIVTIYARHLAYDLAGIVVKPYTTNSIRTALSGLVTNAMTTNPFVISTTRTTAARFTVARPTSAWELLGGTEGSILDVYGGEYTFDGFSVTLSNRRGSDNGVSVRYGVNMTDLEQDTNCAECYTGVVAYYEDENGVVYSPVVSISNNYGYVRIMPVDMSQDFEGRPTVDQLTAAAQAYIAANDIGVPVVSWKISFVPLDITEEYKDLAILERVSLGDTVGVEFEALGVSASARVNAIEWDVLLDRYDTVSLGSVKSNIADTISANTTKLANVPTKKTVQSIAEQISTTLTNTILGAQGGAVRLLDTDGDGEPDTLYIADNADPAQAVKVWRFNYEGWAASENGYNGPFKLGATLDAGLLAEFVTAANLTAGVIQSADNGATFYLNLDTGELRIGGYATDADIADFVTGTELATAGQTVINGGNITTGTLSADRVRAGTLQSQNSAFELMLNTGKMVTTWSATYTGSNYSSSDVSRIVSIISGGTTPTTADYTKYDFYKDGAITLTDLSICRAIVNSGSDLTIKWTLTLDPTDRNETIKIVMKKTGAQTGTTIVFAAGLSGVKTKAAVDAESVYCDSLYVNGVEFGAAIQSAVFGLGTALTAGTNILTLSPGKYYAASDAIASGLTNCPTTFNFVLYVSDRNRAGTRRQYLLMDATNTTYTNAQTSNTAWVGWRRLNYTTV